MGPAQNSIRNVQNGPGFGHWIFEFMICFGFRIMKRRWQSGKVPSRRPAFLAIGGSETLPLQKDGERKMEERKMRENDRNMNRQKNGEKADWGKDNGRRAEGKISNCKLTILLHIPFPHLPFSLLSFLSPYFSVEITWSPRARSAQRIVCVLLPRNRIRKIACGRTKLSVETQLRGA